MTYLSRFKLKTNNPIKVSKPLSKSNSNPNLYPLNSSSEFMLRKKHKTGEAIAMKGVILSFTFRFVKSPKEYNPSKGPYVYPAIVNNLSITARSFKDLNIKIHIKKIRAIVI